MALIYPKEKPLLTIMVVISAIFWLVLVVETFGLALLYLGLFALIYLFAQSAFISFLKGSAVKLSPQQFPDLHQRLLDCCTKLEIKKVPEAYLMHGNGIFNAMATRFLGRDFLVLYSDVVDALEDHPGAINFYIGHELGHISRGHLIWGPFLFPAGMLPLLGAAYSRAREYTCDRHGLACTDSHQDAIYGLSALAAGARRWKDLSKGSYIAQEEANSGFWMSFNELISDYPWLVKRIAAIDRLATQESTRPVQRHPLAFGLALFMPRLGMGGASSSLLVLMIVGIMAAISIPEFLAIQAKAEITKSIEKVQPLENAVEDYAMTNRQWPTQPQDIGLNTQRNAYGSAVKSVALGKEGALVITFANGSVANKSLILDPWVLKNGQIEWHCLNNNIPKSSLPENCSDEK